MKALLIVLAVLAVVALAIFVWVMCRAAALGDRMDEEIRARKDMSGGNARCWERLETLEKNQAESTLDDMPLIDPNRYRII